MSSVAGAVVIATRTIKILAPTCASPTAEMSRVTMALRIVAAIAHGLSRNGTRREVGRATALRAGPTHAEVSTNSCLASCMAKVGVCQVTPSYNKMDAFT